jgi:N-carbamoyl-L-amino-acid hydrolase
MTRPADAAARIDAARLWARHEALAAFGATRRGGVNRQALSTEDIEAQRQLIAWGRDLGLRAFHDPAGNLFLRREGSEPDLAPVLTGSHLDSQPTGGRYDGVYGVLAALEAIQAIGEAGAVTRRPIEIVAWMNEEGSRFAPGMMGSEAFAGLRSLDQIRAVRDADGVAVGDELVRLFAAFPDVARRSLGFAVAAFVEAHIEQGPELDAAGIPIGVVSGIQGKQTYRVTVTGEAGHAGTTPRRMRRDALRDAAALIDALHRDIVDMDDVVRFTVGRIVAEPNAPSVIPSTVVFSIDLRHPEADALNRFGETVARLCVPRPGGCTVALTPLVDAPPLVFPAAIRDMIRAAAARLGVASLDLPSAAGHDARNLHYLCPTGMIFVPCKDGISHNEAEAATPEDLAAGARVLAEILLELAAR